MLDSDDSEYPYLFMTDNFDFIVVVPHNFPDSRVPPRGVPVRFGPNFVITG